MKLTRFWLQRNGRKIKHINNVEFWYVGDNLFKCCLINSKYVIFKTIEKVT